MSVSSVGMQSTRILPGIRTVVRLADCTRVQTASVRHRRIFQCLSGVARSESLRLTSSCQKTKCLEGSMARKFDVIAIGTGSAASTVAARCREAGWQVAIVDSRPFGGTCALRGCDPKKVLVGAAESVDWTRRMKGKGIQAAKLQIDWPELMRFKRSFTEPVTKRREDDFAKAGIEAFHGRARFAGPTTVQVGEETLEGRYVVIATGDMPADLQIPGT